MRNLETMLSAAKDTDDRALGTSVLPQSRPIWIALLTGGGDRHYAFGLATALISEQVNVDVIGGDEVYSAEMNSTPGLNFYNLRRHVRPNANIFEKASRTAVYYMQLMFYAATAKPKVFHILWNNRFEYLDRTLLMLYYRLLGKQIVLTAHNVNAGARDGADTKFNRLTLKIQYSLASHIFVHTEKMKAELMDSFHLRKTAVSVIEYGINNAIPNTDLSPDEARAQLGINACEKTILFFGNLAPYKGVEYLVSALEEVVVGSESDYLLIIAGRPKKGCEEYVEQIQHALRVSHLRSLSRIELIPDEDVEMYFKAADVLALPYTHIFQSGVLFLGYSFGLPAIGSDVGSLKDSIIDGVTGFICRPNDSSDLASAIRRYFSSELYASLRSRRREIRDYMEEKHSWAAVSKVTKSVYARLLEPLGPYSVAGIR